MQNIGGWQLKCYILIRSIYFGCFEFVAYDLSLLSDPWVFGTFFRRYKRPFTRTSLDLLEAPHFPSTRLGRQDLYRRKWLLAL